MPGYIEDRWLTKKKDPETGKRRRTARYGKGKRYKVAGIPGVRDRSFHILEDAKTWLADSQTDVRRGDFFDPRAGKITLREYVEEHWWPSHTGAASSRAAMKSRIWNHVLPHLGDLPLVQIGASELRAWLAVISKSLAPGSVRVTWAHLRTILGAAVEDGRLPHNPVRRSRTVKVPRAPEKKPRAWARQKIAAVYREMRKEYRILVPLGSGIGVRQAEGFGFSPDDLDREAGEAHIRRQLRQDTNGQMYFCPPKGGKERTAPAPPELMAAVGDHMREHPPVTVTLPWRDSEESKEKSGTVTVRLLTTTVTGKPIRFDAFNKHVWRSALGAAGYLKRRENPPRGASQWEADRDEGYHCLRHSYATMLLQAGVNPVAVSAWLGHSDPGFTLRKYGHAMPKDSAHGRAAIRAWLSGPSADSPQILPSAVNDLGQSVAAALERVRPVECWKVRKPSSQVVCGSVEDFTEVPSLAS